VSIIYDILGPIARRGLTWLSRRRLPQTAGTLSLAGLSAPVEVIRDRWGIPHIYARSNQDLFFAQGFVHAQDRLWQMELNRRMGLGRLSELFGELALSTDRTVRTFGFNRLGRIDWANATGDVEEILRAYTAGVNAFLESPDTKLPIEFTLLAHRPEPWQPTDTLAFSRIMLWQMSGAWYSEIIRSQIVQTVGNEHATELEIHYPDTDPITLPTGIEFNRLDPDGSLRRVKGPFLDRGKGSNAWAISSHKSVTGHPILCNDMHLALVLPSLWYEAHLISDDFNVTGVTLPGVPLVMVGHNAQIAWGITVAFTDCEDLFIEKVDSKNPPRYQFQGEWLDAEVITEPIHIKRRTEPHLEHVNITRHGPIISDVIGVPDQRIAVKSMALQPTSSFGGWLRLNRAAGWDDFVEAIRLIDATQLNVMYADVKGNIGYWVTGKVPVRARGTGTVPVPGWKGEYEWIGEVPFDEMPHSLNPDRGYIVSCNNRIVSDDYPHFLGNMWMNGYRARKIADFIAGKERLSIEDLIPLHVDFTCLPGQEFVTQTTGFTCSDPDGQLALEHLRKWDGRLTPDSVGGTLYEVTRYALVRNLLEPGLGKELTLRLMGQGFHPVLAPAHEFYGHDTVTMLRLLDNPNSWWVKQAGGREAVLTRSLKQAVEWLRTELGPNMDSWAWGRIHRVTFGHALGLKKPLDRVFSRGPFPIGGDTDTPCQTAMLVDEPYDCKAWGPSFRQIVDLGDLSRSMTIFPPGQSGQLGSPHYDDLIEPWLKGDYHPMLWTREQVEQEGESRLILKGLNWESE
jgi:penicillin amidase